MSGVADAGQGLSPPSMPESVLARLVKHPTKKLSQLPKEPRGAGVRGIIKYPIGVPPDQARQRAIGRRLGQN